MALFLGLVGAVLSVVFWISGPQKSNEIEIAKLRADIESNQMITEKIQNIKDNDLHEIQGKLDEQQKQLVEIQKAIDALKKIG